MDEGRTEDGPWLYYKLTNESKGSRELKKLLEVRRIHLDNKKTDFFLQKNIKFDLFHTNFFLFIFSFVFYGPSRL